MSAGTVVWITGLPASGKSTLARAVEKALGARGRSCVVLDGDEVRAALVPQPGYSEPERAAFYETLANLAALFARGGHDVVVAATAHRRAFRDRARALAPRFVEVHVATPKEECARRDPKGLYRAAAGGALALPGAGADYEPPLRPEVIAQDGLDARAVEAIARALLPRPPPT